jgi:hypothetical protein
MNSSLRISLNANAEQAARLLALQAVFAKACNALAPLVRQTRCWNRVTLHHLYYKSLREQFPDLGSQMVCNVIYSVSRTSRHIYQHPQSPFNIARLQDKPLPLLNFAETCPVYFDRHTLSVKDGRLSMYTLDGRMRFDLVLGPQAEAGFRERKLREIVLSRTPEQDFELCFFFSQAQADGAASAGAETGEVPEYVMVEEAA